MSEAILQPPTHHWDAYNARSLRDEEIAARFVPPPFFDTLLSPQHQLVVGPRGSGKTTLLRMLQQNALATWKHRNAARVRGTIAFEGIFVPADRSWGEQFRVDSEGARPDLQAAIANATFTTHVLRSLVRTLILHARTEASDDRDTTGYSREAEEDLSRHFLRAWQMGGGLPSFNGVRQELRLRLSWLARARKRLRRGDVDVDTLESLDWIDLDFLGEVGSAVEAVNDHLGVEGKRWALLFDELEVAPDEIRSALIGSLRVPDAHLVLKLALSPYPGRAVSFETQTSLAATPREGHDYDLISLTHPERVSVDRFGRQILDSLIRHSAEIESSPERIFGQSRISTPAAQWLTTGTAYAPGTRKMNALATYIKSDPGVLSYLESRGITVDKVGLVRAESRAAHLRKIAPLVALREYYSEEPSPGSTRRKYRQRKTYGFYTGLAMLLAISEGNPRSILYLFGPMLEEASWKENARIDESTQSRAIEELMASFRTLLKTIPAPTAGTVFSDTVFNSASRGLLDLLDHIGEYFAEYVYSTDFTPDPPGSFIVDAHTPDETLAAIEAAVNVGALIFVPDADGLDYFGSARGKRLRLNFLLAAHHRLPLRLGRSVSLSSIFERDITAGRDDSGLELTLFPDSELKGR